MVNVNKVNVQVNVNKVNVKVNVNKVNDKVNDATLFIATRKETTEKVPRP